MHKVFLKPCNYELPRTPEIFDVVTNVYATTKVIAVEYAITYLLLTLQFQNKVKVPVDLQGCQQGKLLSTSVAFDEIVKVKKKQKMKKYNNIASKFV